MSVDPIVAIFADVVILRPNPGLRSREAYFSHPNLRVNIDLLSSENYPLRRRPRLPQLLQLLQPLLLFDIFKQKLLDLGDPRIQPDDCYHFRQRIGSFRRLDSLQHSPRRRQLFARSLSRCHKRLLQRSRHCRVDGGFRLFVRRGFAICRMFAGFPDRRRRLSAGRKGL